jgi:crotonobetainyl-CoA:carnitine CoA-transferase CaiB-like acyl-CoA transferase
VTAPLEGLRVVEIAGDIAGPFCTKLLVDLGADVTKVEPPAGDPLRQVGPFPGGEPIPIDQDCSVPECWKAWCHTGS